MRRVACIDLEGVLIPELWPHVAAATEIPELARTTREVPDYSLLVQQRIALLRRHGIRLCDVQEVIAGLTPCEGAGAFLDELRMFEVSLISDAFAEMVSPLWRLLGQPDLQCHRLVCDRSGFITEARYVRLHGKHEVIEALATAGAWTLAVGDAFNDLSMLRLASLGVLFRPSQETIRVAPDLPVATCYRDVLTLMDRAGVPIAA